MIKIIIIKKKTILKKNNKLWNQKIKKLILNI